MAEFSSALERADGNFGFQLRPISPPPMDPLGFEMVFAGGPTGFREQRSDGERGRARRCRIGHAHSSCARVRLIDQGTVVVLILIGMVMVHPPAGSPSFGLDRLPLGNCPALSSGPPGP